MGFPVRYAKIVGGGILAAGLIIAVIVLGVEVARLSGELDDIQNQQPTTTSTPGTTTEDPSTLDPWDREYRLPASLKTEHYDLTLNPRFHDLEAGEEPTFSGTVVIKFQLEEDGLEYLTFHEKDLTIEGKPVLEKIENGFPIDIPLSKAFKAPRNEFYVLQPTEGLLKGVYTLEVQFNGSLNKTDIVGFYMSQYTDDKGANRKLVTSKFEPTYARRAFPCFDEPDKKATYTIKLVKPADDNWVALSNTMNMNEVAGPVGFKTVEFSESVPMSTYLACFIVSEFTALPPKLLANGEKVFPLKTWAPSHLTEYTQHALDVAEKVTSYYIKYFGIPYPMPKLDLIAIPDFVSGAMEHWGLITFRETSMIINPDKSSRSNYQRVAEVVAHELAHMWFGNLVTMKWWDDLWLNEGFASFIEYKGVNEFASDWEMEGQFVIQDLQPVMALDAQLSSHPIIQAVDHPDQITELFDSITYSKGSAVLRMLESFLGQTNFQEGIKSYLKKFEYSNAQTADLWASLQEHAAAGVNVSRTMDTWTKQMNFPVINVEMGASPKTVVVTQERFLATSPEAGKKDVESPFGYKWDIPIWCKIEKQPDPLLKWLPMEQASVSIDIYDATWVMLNAGQIGVYRVNYSIDLWNKLLVVFQTHDDKVLTPVERSALLDDVFSLAEANLVEYSLALTFGSALKGEQGYIPWVTASGIFSKMSPLMRGQLSYPKYLAYLRSGLVETYKPELWEVTNTNSHIDCRRAAVILDHACSSGVTECLDEAGKRFAEWINDVATPIDSNIKSVVYNQGMRKSGDSDTWQIVWDRYKAETDPQEKSKLMRSLSTVNDVAVLQLFIELAWDESNVKGQDYFTVLEYISENPIGTPLVWDYVRDNWLKLVERFTLNNRYLGRLISRITKNFNTNIRKEEMLQFFETYPDAGAGASARAQALERVELNIKWMAEQYPKIEDWLNGPKF